MTNQSIFTHISEAQADPILGITEKFLADTNPFKINLGVGVYQNNEGKSAKLAAVKKAEELLIYTDIIATYPPIDGILDFRTNTQEFLFGKDHSAIKSQRVATCQTPGGTGAIRIGAEFLKLFFGKAEVYISSPSWDNHKAIFEATGFPVILYPYYDSKNKCIDFDGCVATLNNAKAGSIVVLHAACHNPTGYDFSSDHWNEILTLCQKKNLIVFLDIAYQGFETSFEEDRKIILECEKRGMTFLVASSCSKNFGLYAERIGALSIICHTKDESRIVQTQLKRIVRTIYSNPPARGAKIVNTICTDAELKALWLTELAEMCNRIKTMRSSFAEKLAKSKIDYDFSHIQKQKGMFSFSGIPKENILWLRDNKSIYALESGRICVAALNNSNIDLVVEAIEESFKHTTPQR